MNYRPELKELVEYLNDLIESGYKISSVAVDYTSQNGNVFKGLFNYHKEESLQRVKGCIL